MVVCILQIIVFFIASVFYGGVLAAFLSRYHTNRVAVCFVPLPSRSGGFDMIKESSWVHEFFYQRKRSDI